MTNLLSPYVKTQGREIQPVVLGADATTIVFRAPYACTLAAVRYIPNAALTGAATNNRTHNLYNRSTGAGVVVMATLNYASGVNLVDNVSKVIPLSATAANLEMAAGDVLEFESLHVGTGLADPGGLLELDYVRAD